MATKLRFFSQKIDKQITVIPNSTFNNKVVVDDIYTVEGRTVKMLYFPTLTSNASIQTGIKQLLSVSFCRKRTTDNLVFNFATSANVPLPASSSSGVDLYLSSAGVFGLTINPLTNFENVITGVWIKFIYN